MLFGSIVKILLAADADVYAGIKNDLTVFWKYYSSGLLSC
jgi:hypothetical protein